MPVRELAAADCTLFLWVTFPVLPETFDVIKAWGFTYKTVAFCWVKRNPKSPGWFFGMGNWTRANAEICLLATKGNPKRKAADVPQLIVAPREEHSKKPDETRDRIVRLMGDLPRVELFARRPRLAGTCGATKFIPLYHYDFGPTWPEVKGGITIWHMSAYPTT